MAEGRQRAAVTTAQHWPPDRAFFLHLLPLLTFPRQQLLLCTTFGGTALSGPPLRAPPPLPGRRSEGMLVTAWQGGRTTLGIVYQGAGLPSSFTRRLQSEPATSFLQLLSQALGSSDPSLHPSLQHLRALFSGTLHSVCYACTLSPQSQLDVGSQKGSPEKQGPVGPYRLRVEGLACDGVRALVAEAFP